MRSKSKIVQEAWDDLDNNYVYHHLAELCCHPMEELPVITHAFLYFGDNLILCSLNVITFFSTLSILNSKFLTLWSKISRMMSVFTLKLGIVCLLLCGLSIGGDGKVQLSWVFRIVSSNVLVIPVGVTIS